MPNPNEYLAKKSLLDTKQDILTAGANININNNNVISVQGLPKDVKVNGSSVVDANGNANIDLTGKQDTLTAGNNITIQNNVISANIEANPQDTPTADLDSIDIDGTVYNIAGSGGTSVIPNPVGTPTDTLTTVEIDGTIFDIAGSGGGGSYTETLLYEDTSGTVGTSSITLTDRLDKYDALYFEYFFPNETTYVESTPSPLIMIVETPTGSMKGKYYISTYPTYGNRYIELSSDGSTTASLTTGTWSENIKPSVYHIYGVKLGNNGGGNSHKDFKNLITPPITTTGTVTLNDSIENYDFIEVELTYLNGEGNPVCGSTMASVEYLKNNYNNATSIWVDGGNNDRSVKVAFSNSTTMIVGKASITDAITGVYGINIQSGGGGSESKYEQVDLYVNQGITQPNVITLSQDISDFDAIVIENVNTSDANAYRTTDYFLTDEMSIGKYYTCLRWANNNEYINFQVTTLNTLTMVDYRNMYTIRVVGVKYGAGGGGGTSVEANPQEQPTDTLTKIKIEDTVYEIQGGGSSEGSGLQRTILWDYALDNAGTIPYDIYSVTLRDDINNYDAITLELVSYAGDLNGSWRGTNISNTFFVDMLNNQLEPGNAVICTFSQRSVKFYIHDNIVSTTVRNESSTNGLVRVYGLTFGGGKAASEIIPISAGDGTTSRTFTFNKTPKFIAYYWNDPVLDNGWNTTAHFVWGQEFVAYSSATNIVSINNNYQGCMRITYNGNSITFTGGNAFSVCNTVNGSGYMYVDYGGGSGGSSEPDISDMTWTVITSTSYGQSTAAAIPQGTKKLVLTAEYNSIVTKVAEEKIENIQKLLDTSLQNTWNMGAEYADTAGNHTFVAMSVNNNLATAYSGYSGVVVKIYALS